jgi:hypothetical protein
VRDDAFRRCDRSARLECEPARTEANERALRLRPPSAFGAAARGSRGHVRFRQERRLGVGSRLRQVGGSRVESLRAASWPATRRIVRDLWGRPATGRRRCERRASTGCRTGGDGCRAGPDRSPRSTDGDVRGGRAARRTPQARFPESRPGRRCGSERSSAGDTASGDAAAPIGIHGDPAGQATVRDDRHEPGVRQHHRVEPPGPQNGDGWGLALTGRPTRWRATPATRRPRQCSRRHKSGTRPPPSEPPAAITATAVGTPAATCSRLTDPSAIGTDDHARRRRGPRGRHRAGIARRAQYRVGRLKPPRHARGRRAQKLGCHPRRGGS